MKCTVVLSLLVVVLCVYLAEAGRGRGGPAFGVGRRSDIPITKALGVKAVLAMCQLDEPGCRSLDEYQELVKEADDLTNDAFQDAFTS